MRRRVESVARILAAIVTLTLVVAAVVASTVGTPTGKEPEVQYAPDRIIVGFAADVNVYDGQSGTPMTAMASVDNLNTRFGVKRMDPVYPAIATSKTAATGLERELGNVYVLTFAPGTDPIAAAQAYAKLPDVRYAEPDYIRHALRTDPNDPYWPTSNAWGEDYRDQWDMELIRCPDVWDIQTGSASVVIAVIDTGVDYNHADLAANMWHNPSEIPDNGIDDDGNGKIDDYHGYDFNNNDANPLDDNGHGTHCAGTIGAVGDNGIGIAGVNWHCSVMAVKGLSSVGSGSVTPAWRPASPTPPTRAPTSSV